VDARSCVVDFASNIINFRPKCRNTCWGFVTYLANKRGISRGCLTHYNGLEGTTFKLCFVDLENARSADQIFTLLIVATQVSNACKRLEGQTKFVCDIGGDGLRPHMAVVSLVHSLH
jgi:hypothetical protein